MKISFVCVRIHWYPQLLVLAGAFFAAGFLAAGFLAAALAAGFSAFTSAFGAAFLAGAFFAFGFTSAVSSSAAAAGLAVAVGKKPLEIFRGLFTPYDPLNRFPLFDFRSPFPIILSLVKSPKYEKELTFLSFVERILVIIEVF